MRRILAFWLILFPINLVVCPAIDYLLFNHVDIRYEALVLFFVIPLAQTVALAAGLGIVTWGSVILPLRTIGRSPAVGLFVLLDAVVLSVTLMPGMPESISLSLPDGFASWYMGIKALAGGMLVVAASLSGRWTDWNRRWLLLIGVLLCAHGLDYFTPWLALLSRPFIARWSLLYGWLLFYGPLFVLVVLLLARLEAIWHSHSRAAGFTVRYAAAFAVIGATMVSLNVYNRPFLLEPWASVAKGCAYLTLTALLAASLIVVVDRNRPLTAEV